VKVLERRSIAYERDLVDSVGVIDLSSIVVLRDAAAQRREQGNSSPSSTTLNSCVLVSDRISVDLPYEAPATRSTSSASGT